MYNGGPRVRDVFKFELRISDRADTEVQINSAY